ADRLSAECRGRDRAVRKRYATGLSDASNADRLQSMERALRQPPRAIKHRASPKRVVIEQADSAAENCFAGFTRVPCCAELRGEIGVGLTHAIPQSGAELIESGDRSKVSVGAATVTDVVHAKPDHNIRLEFPDVAGVSRETFIDGKSAVG